MNKYLSIITLNMNGLNALIRRLREGEWIRKHDPDMCCLKESHLRTKDLHRLKVKGWKKIFQANRQDAPFQASHLMQSLLAKHQVTQPPYNTDLLPCNIWLFLKLKSPLKGKRFQTINEIQENMGGQMMALGELCEVPWCLL